MQPPVVVSVPNTRYNRRLEIPAHVSRNIGKMVGDTNDTGRDTHKTASISTRWSIRLNVTQQLGVELQRGDRPMTVLEKSPVWVDPAKAAGPLRHFSTDMFAPHERASAWREAYGQSIA